MGAENSRHRRSGWETVPLRPPGESSLDLGGEEGHFGALTGLSGGQDTLGEEGSLGE